MRVYREKYGVDADSNRATVMTNYELEDSDNADIESELMQNFDGADYDDKVTITLLAPDDNEVEFEVVLSDYMDELKWLTLYYDNLSPEFNLEGIRIRICQADDAYFILEDTNVIAYLDAPLEGINLLDEVQNRLKISKDEKKTKYYKDKLNKLASHIASNENNYNRTDLASMFASLGYINCLLKYDIYDDKVLDELQKRIKEKEDIK